MGNSHSLALKADGTVWAWGSSSSGNLGDGANVDRPTPVQVSQSSGLVDTSVVDVGAEVLICALTGGIVWNLITWYLGLPSSSSHAMIGGLCGAALAASHDNWAAIIWSQPADPWYKGAGLLWKVVVPMIVSQAGGFRVT